jgi:hypothetical protein
MIYGYNADFEWALVHNKTTIKAIAQKFVNRLIDKREGELVRDFFTIPRFKLMQVNLDG